MQDLAGATMEVVNPQFLAPEEEKQQQLKCPRCESTNTKFCYYNNYNLSQPRHFCKDCRRYWTKGGTLRNIPVGGGTRKNSKRSSPADADASNPKRLSTSAPADPSSTPIRLPKPEPLSVVYPPFGQEDRMLEITGTFSSLLASNGNFGGLLETFHSGDSGIGRLPSSTDQILLAGAPAPELQSSNDSSGSEQPAPQTENFLCLQGDSSCWLGGWPDLSIYTPGSSFQ